MGYLSHLYLNTNYNKKSQMSRMVGHLNNLKVNESQMSQMVGYMIQL